jgi:pimeloyl-ACP methyl ester carboxylesterase
MPATINAVRTLPSMAPLTRIRLKHGSVAVRMAGTGRPLFLIHGWGASSIYWAQTVATLGETRQVVAIDLPGFGQSPALSQPALAARQAEAVIELADALGLGEFDVCGHSFGGVVATYLAACYPERVRRVVFVSFAVRTSAAELALLALLWPGFDLGIRLWQPWLNACEPIYQLWRPLATLCAMIPPLPQIMLQSFVDQPQIAPEVLRTGVIEMMATDPRAHLGCIISTSDPMVSFLLQQIKQPTLFLAGRGDRVVPLDQVRATAKLVAGAATCVLEHCGHIPMFEQAAMFQQQVRQFLAEP